MGPFEKALLISLAVAVIFSVLNLFVFKNDRRDDGFGSRAVGSLATGVVLFCILFVVNFCILYFVRPASVGMYGGWLWLMVDLVIAVVVFTISDSIPGVFSLGTILGWVVLFLWLMHACGSEVFTPFGGGNAADLASVAKIEEMPSGTYPETDADHILLVPEEAALFHAKQVISKATDEKTGRNLSTIYRPDYPALQSINNHLYWVFQLTFTGYRVSNQVDRIVPGYIVVDAEDPNAEPQVRLGYKMRYTLGAPFANSLSRHIYNNGYSNWMVDDLSIEIRDDGKPFYSASLNSPALRFKGSVPRSMILIDAETGEIQEYPLNEIPEWVDRVYSRHVVEDMLEWWGHWGKAPWKWAPFETAAYRMKPAGKPHLVYTKGGHPAWQVLMTSWNSDTSVISVVLFEGRSNTARVYPVSGIAIEDSVLNSFATAKKNIKDFRPVHPSIHRIYGELTWVVAYISASTGLDGAASFQAVGLIPASNVQGANVIYAEQKSRAFTEYRQFLAQGTSNQAPEENSLTKAIEGTVTNVAQATIEGNTNYFITLDVDATRVFQGAIGESIELPFIENGIRVRITYLDVGKAIVDIMDYDDLGMDLDTGSTASVETR